MKVDLDALRSIEREKGLNFDIVVEALESALASAYKRQGSGAAEEARVEIDRGTGAVSVFAQELDDDGNVLREWADEPSDFGRIVAQTAKQVLMQRLREAERELTYGEYTGKEGDLVTGTLQIHDNRVLVLDLGNAEAVLPYAEQVHSERYDHGTRLKAIITEVRRSLKGPQIICSRSHPDLVRELFRLEVPEIADNTIRIRGIAREAGHRTKIAVESTDETVDPVGACVGARGSRVMAVVEELSGEKVDIVPWADNSMQLVANSLSPAKVQAVYLYEDEGTALVIVPDYQLSLAIGREGQNARLAARLTGWRIDIKSETQFAEEQAAFEEALARGEIDEHGNPLVTADEAEVPLPSVDPVASAGPADAPPPDIAAATAPEPPAGEAVPAPDEPAPEPVAPTGEGEQPAAPEPSSGGGPDEGVDAPIGPEAGMSLTADPAPTAPDPAAPEAPDATEEGRGG